MSCESSAAALPGACVLGAGLGSGGPFEGSTEGGWLIDRTTSSRVIRPRSPVGCTRPRSTPISSASLRVDGDAGGAPGGWFEAVAWAGSPAPGGWDCVLGGG